MMFQAAARLIARMIPNMYKAGRLVGKGLGRVAVGASVRFIKKQLENGAEVDLKLTKVDDLYVDPSGNVNKDGIGTYAASIYDGNDGNSYLDLGEEIRVWNGSAWV